MQLYTSLLLLLFCQLASGYKILVFSPTISRSHMISNGRIADELAKAGHDVIMFEPDFLNIFDHVKAAKVARRWPVRGFSDALLKVLSGFSTDVFEDLTTWANVKGTLDYNEAYDAMCQQIIENDDLMQQLRNEKFDAYFGEQINLCGNGLAHALGIKVHFWISSCMVFENMAWHIGQPSQYSYTAAGGMDMGIHPDYWTRAKNILYGTTGFIVSNIVNWRTTQVFRQKFGQDFPYVGEIAGNSDIIFISTDEFVEIPRPIMPNQINIGGLGISDETGELDKKFEEEMKKGGKGVIFFSLGTIVNTTLLPSSVMNSLASVAEAFPEYHFIARVDAKDSHAFSVAKGVENLEVFDWVPQPSLLRHPRLKMFITHSGYNGVIEAARAGVPLITMPFMFDQPKNSQAVALNGWGVPVHRRALRDDPQLIIDAIKEILHNDKYKKAALRIQKLVKTKPFNASERLIRTTEFVLENGGIKELLVEGRNHSLIHLYNLDIFIPFALIFLFFSYFSLKMISSSFCSSGKYSKVKTN